MARKVASPRKARASKTSNAVAVVTTVAALIGYDPALLLPAPSMAAPLTSPALPSDYALIDGFIANYPPTLLPVQAHEVVTEVLENEPPVTEADSFTAMMAGMTAVEIEPVALRIVERFSARVAYETDKNPDNLNIHRTLRKTQAELSRESSQKVMLACGVDPSFIDRQLRDGARYNVYAIDKVADLVSYLAGNVSLNRINNAVIRSLFRFEAAELDFTGEMAKAAASDKIRVEPRFRAHLTSHTVSASTAPTQASSTMQALVTLGVVKAEGSSKNPTFRLTDSAATRYLRERIAA